MLAAAVLATWWAQAEPAPAGAAPSQSAAPLVVAPPPTPPPPFDKQATVFAGVSRRLGPEGKRVAPLDGPSLGGDFARRYLAFAGFDLDLGLTFLYDQFEDGALAATSVSQTSFALTQTVGWRWRRLRPYVQLGGGFTIAYLSVPTGSLDVAQPLGRGTVGLDVAITRDIGVTVRAAYTLLFTRPTLTTEASATAGAMTYSALGDLFDADLGVVFQF
ncbi:MAG TPA: hypothetical protein VH853_20750 [Polyangia bacterium]|jgi:hypothetical protein|nr:hypothetical protein [Polyangia bacterium]